MAKTLTSIIETYEFYMHDAMDQRSIDVFYIRSPFPWMILVAVYIYAVKVWGPNYMSKRPAYQLNGVIKIYNIFQVVINLYLFYLAIRIVTAEQFIWRCMPVLYDTSEYAILILNSGYIYFWVKILDLLDTVFFVLRKKNNQITFLHVYHHSMMVFGVWIGIKYVPGGNPIILPLLNSFVHVVMYTYYFLSNASPEYKKSLWWKKHLTQLQMVQFVLIAVHTAQVLINNTCRFPVVLASLLVIQNMFVFFLFLKFYVNAYITKTKIK